MAFGGYRGLAEAIGVDPLMAVHWPRRGIPARYWPAVEETELARDIGVTAQLLDKQRKWKKRHTPHHVREVA